MTSWFANEERSKRLQAEALAWLGTPFLANSAERGKGASCQKLASEIYRRVGCCDIEVPAVSMAHAQFSRVSLVEEWMDGRPEFVRLPAIAALQAGDLLGFRLGRVVHHVGIYLGDGMFVHAMSQVGTIRSALSDATWGSRLQAAWRPVEEGERGTL